MLFGSNLQRAGFLKAWHCLFFHFTSLICFKNILVTEFKHITFGIFFGTLITSIMTILSLFAYIPTNSNEYFIPLNVKCPKLEFNQFKIHKYVLYFPGMTLDEPILNRQRIFTPSICLN